MARRLVRADGHGIPPLLEAVLRLFPLDSFVDRPAAVMAPVGSGGAGTAKPSEPPIWEEYRRVIKAHEPAFTDFERIERFAFYERARQAYAVLATGEASSYGNVILKKGVIRSQ